MDTLIFRGPCISLYIVDSVCWCPPPFTMGLDVYSYVLLQGLHTSIDWKSVGLSDKYIPNGDFTTIVKADGDVNQRHIPISILA